VDGSIRGRFWRTQQSTSVTEQASHEVYRGIQNHAGANTHKTATRKPNQPPVRPVYGRTSAAVRTSRQAIVPSDTGELVSVLGMQHLCSRERYEGKVQQHTQTRSIAPAASYAMYVESLGDSRPASPGNSDDNKPGLPFACGNRITSHHENDQARK
jgi:hypothetical protein